MRLIALTTIATLSCFACGGPTAAPERSAAAAEPASGGPAGGGEAKQSGEFVLRDSDTVKETHGATPSKLKPTKTEAVIKFIVVDKEKGPIPGIVVALTSPDGQKFYTQETDSTGFAEVLVPVGKKYDLVYLSLGRRDVAASVPVTNEPNQNIKLTMRYKFHAAPPPVKNAPEAVADEPRFVLDGVQFDVGKATIRPESLPRLDSVAEYMTHKPSTRIEISGHSDNVGNPKNNKELSEKRAAACRDYLASKGIEASRVDAVGFGDERPIASNGTEEGRQQNRRIEAKELTSP
jgi:outer membrane protein OmpA-like peptidoglycan-associated protein